MKAADKDEQKILVKNVNLKLEEGKLKNELNRAMSRKDMEEFKR